MAKPENETDDGGTPDPPKTDKSQGGEGATVQKSGRGNAGKPLALSGLIVAISVAAVHFFPQLLKPVRGVVLPFTEQAILRSWTPVLRGPGLLKADEMVIARPFARFSQDAGVVPRAPRPSDPVSDLIAAKFDEQAVLRQVETTLDDLFGDISPWAWVSHEQKGCLRARLQLFVRERASLVVAYLQARAIEEPTERERRVLRILERRFDKAVREAGGVKLFDIGNHRAGFSVNSLDGEASFTAKTGCGLTDLSIRIDVSQQCMTFSIGKHDFKRVGMGGTAAGSALCNRTVTTWPGTPPDLP